MSKYFLDCGAHDGCSIRLFRASTPNSSEYVIHSFEPNPAFAEQLRRIPDVVFHPEAVWIKDCEASFYVSRAVTRDGSTLIASKTTGRLDRDHPLKVRCINFGSWVLRTFGSDDVLVLKLDIEGAEYEVLRSMCKDGSIRKIHKLYIEFHAERIGLARETHDRLVADLAQAGLKIHPWDALGH